MSYLKLKLKRRNSFLFIMKLMLKYSKINNLKVDLYNKILKRIQGYEERNIKMRGYIGVTDRQWFNNLKSQYILNEVNFWRKNTNSFKSLELGQKFFFLVKNDKYNKAEREVLGVATFIRYEVLTIEEAWGKYEIGNGVNTKEEFYVKMKKMYQTNIENSLIGCIILNNVEFFEKEVLLSKLNIEFQTSIVSGKGISQKEVDKILDINNIDNSSSVNEENIGYYVNQEELQYEREVISIPSSATIDLIYKYGIHAHPNDNKRYPYKKSLFYTFRENGGVMSKLYELNTVVKINPIDISQINNIDIDTALKERLKGYIEERKKTFTFHEDGEYKFYIFNEVIELTNKVALPKQNNHAYFTIKEIFSGKYLIDRCNKDTKETRSDLINYIKLIKKKLNKSYLEEDENEDILLVKELKDFNTVEFLDSYEYQGKKKEKEEPKIQNGIKVYKRDRKVALNALAHAKYKCEIDEGHPTFIRKNTEIAYTEPHHLIPMAYSDLFDVSLDVEENIVSLCSNCHNHLHYGRGYEVLLKSIYDERIKELKKVGLYIEFEKLLQMYL